MLKKIALLLLCLTLVSDIVAAGRSGGRSRGGGAARGGMQRPGGRPGMGSRPGQGRPGGRPGMGSRPGLGRPGGRPGMGLRPGRPGGRPGMGVRPGQGGSGTRWGRDGRGRDGRWAHPGWRGRGGNVVPGYGYGRGYGGFVAAPLAVAGVPLAAGYADGTMPIVGTESYYQGTDNEGYYEDGGDQGYEDVYRDVMPTYGQDVQQVVVAPEYFSQAEQGLRGHGSAMRGEPRYYGV